MSCYNPETQYTLNVLKAMDRFDDIYSKVRLFWLSCETVFKWYLPPANEVWGKVMFSHLSISHSVHGLGVSVWCHFLSGCLVPCSFGGVSVPGPMSLGEGVCPGVSLGKPPESEKWAVRILLECFLVNFCFQFTNWQQLTIYCLMADIKIGQKNNQRNTSKCNRPKWLTTKSGATWWLSIFSFIRKLEKYIW